MPTADYAAPGRVLARRRRPAPGASPATRRTTPAQAPGKPHDKNSCLGPCRCRPRRTTRSARSDTDHEENCHPHTAGVCACSSRFPVALCSYRQGPRSDVPVAQAAGCGADGWCLDGRMTAEQEAPRVVSATREIAAEPERIFELIADPAAQPRWDGNDNLAWAPAGQRVRRAGEVFTMTLTRAASGKTTWSSSTRAAGSPGCPPNRGRSGRGTTDSRFRADTVRSKGAGLGHEDLSGGRDRLRSGWRAGGGRRSHGSQRFAARRRTPSTGRARARRYGSW